MYDFKKKIGIQTCNANFAPICQQNVSFKGLYNVLSTQPVLNKVSEITGL